MSGIQDFLIQQVKNAVLNHTDQQNTGFDPSALLHQISGAASQGGLNPGMVTDLITKHAADQQHTGFDPGPLLSQVQGLFGQHQQAPQDNTSQRDNVSSSGEEENDGDTKSSDDDSDDQENASDAKSSDEDSDEQPSDEDEDNKR